MIIINSKLQVVIGVDHGYGNIKPKYEHDDELPL